MAEVDRDKKSSRAECGQCIVGFGEDSLERRSREVGRLVDLTVHCQGADRPGAVAHRPWEHLAGASSALQTISADLSMTAAAAGADLVHSHTWYANLAGFLAGQLLSAVAVAVSVLVPVGVLAAIVVPVPVVVAGTVPWVERGAGWRQISVRLVVLLRTRPFSSSQRNCTTAR